MTNDHKNRDGEESAAETDGGAVEESSGGLAELFPNRGLDEEDPDRDPEPASPEAALDDEPVIDYRFAAAAIFLAVVGASIFAVYRLRPGLLSAVDPFVLGAVGAGSIGVALLAASNATEEPIRLPDPEPVDALEIVEPPESGEKRSRFGLFGKLLAAYNTRRQRKQLAGKGYIEWYLVEDGWPRPKIIRPKVDATNLPYYKYKGERYFFPRSARLADERGGMWVVVHQRGDADPINLSEPRPHSIPAASLEKWANLVVQTREGLFGGLFDRDPQEILKYGIYAFIGYMILRTAAQSGAIPFL